MHPIRNLFAKWLSGQVTPVEARPAQPTDASVSARLPAVVLAAGLALTALGTRWLHHDLQAHARAALRHGAAPVSMEAPWAMGVIGALCSVLMATLLWQQALGRRRAETLARAMSTDFDRLAVVAQQTSNAVVITDLAGITTWVNAGFERITGYSAAEALGRTPGKLLQCPDTDRLTIARIRTALAAREPFSGELLNRHKNGRLYWIEIDITPMHDAAGTLVGFSAIESDVTERKLAEAALRASQAFLYTTGRIGGVGGWAYDLQAGSVQWTDQSCRILELEIDHPPSLADCWALCTPEARQVLEGALASGLTQGYSWDFELALITGRGRPIWVRLVAEGEFADSGPVRIVGALQDVTERRAMQAEVQRNEQLLRGAIDAIDEAFVLYDADDRLVFCNDKYRAIYSTAAEPIEPGMRFEDIKRAELARGQYPEAVGRESEWLAERLISHRSGSGTAVQPLADGRVMRSIDRRMPDGHLVGFRIDITDLVRSRQAAEGADRAKSEFIATISHELRTPLQSIMGFSELGLTFAKDQAPLDSMFHDIHQGGQRMLRLVNALLDVSKVEGTDARLALQRADLGTLAAQVVRELTPIAAERQVQFRLGVPPHGLPALPVLADGYRIEQVLRNVLANAVRFTAPGSTVEIDGIDHGAAGVTLTVRDHGPGIPSDELEQIFDAFVQSSRTRDGSGGTGLGLTICRKILRAHRGCISAANAAGGGALMRVHLPAGVEALYAAAPPVAADAAAATPSPQPITA
ncbi:MAG: PAS domain S-box protein [Leptothrix sp. (in: b-proteobacteria)]